jgi:hypothetical protein
VDATPFKFFTHAVQPPDAIPRAPPGGSTRLLKAIALGADDNGETDV